MLSFPAVPYGAALSLAIVALLSTACGSDDSEGQPLEEATPDAEDIVFFSDGAESDVGDDDAGGGLDTTSNGDTTPEPGGLGAPCGDNVDCLSGYCIESPTGFVCTQTCLTDCPNGWSCKSVINTLPDVVFICVPDVLSLCLPCDEDKQCGGGKCLTVGDGNFCASGCPEGGCPTGFTCSEIDGEPLCVPDSGTCECSVANDGQIRGCDVANEFGSCPGVQTCNGATGWSACSASTPIPEICDGQDNDCDGALDEDVDDGAPCSLENEFGSCSGVLTCLGVQGSVCSATEPGPELCDYKDNDCDGETDEDFKNGDQYGDAFHCGQCGVSCQGAVPFATSTCNAVDFNPPACVVDECLTGYYEVNPLLCSPLPGKQCDPCDGPEDCLVEGSKCVPIGDSTFCAAPCDSVPCPTGYTCTTDPEAGQVCTPDTGSCSCDGQSPNLQKSCELTFTDPENPDITVTCTGVETCGPDGWSDCVAPEDVCDGLDNDCDGVVDGPWVNDAGTYDTATHCGVCGNNCSVAPPPFADGFCNVDGPVPTCDIACQDGYFDVDQIPSNGCECAYASASDLPDGTDQNCDGVDGEVDNAVFVAKTGDDANPGTIELPKLTVAGGIQEASASGKRDVYVATGVYSEAVVLVAGISIYGGYAGDFFARDTVLYETAILGPAPTELLPGTVNASGLTDDAGPQTTVDGFSIFGWNNLQAGGSSYAIWAPGATSQLRVVNNRIVAGSGGSGTPGAAGISGSAGQDGNDGLAAKDIGKSTCNNADHNLGGGGGAHTCGDTTVDGGDGGRARCPDFDQGSSFPSCPTGGLDQTPANSEFGKNGAGDAPGDGGAAGFDAYIDARYGPFNGYSCNSTVLANCNNCLLPSGEQKVGGNGAPGANGSNGDGGAGCVFAGTVVNGRWVPGDGFSGASATHGSGGGGGGAGGGVETVSCSDDDTGFSDIGGSGGGGGSGGCGGTAGTGGQGGGGSFGIFLAWTEAPASLPEITNNLLVLGNGGAGGSGGPGGVGGAGGAAGAGGENAQAESATFCTEGGGKGGAGGAGGQGGGGGGGCGGASFGIFVDGATGSDAWKTANQYLTTGTGGAGGFGGPSLGAAGAAGGDGPTDTTNF